MAVDTITSYLALAKNRPELFLPSDDIPIILDEEKLRAFSIQTGRPMGLVVDNSPYFLVLSDLCGDSTPFAYVRVVYPEPSSGSVAIPYENGRYGLLEIFRHAPRRLCLEFPRGFATRGLTPEENIAKELGEEIGVCVNGLRKIGQVHPDTGLSAGCADVFLTEVSTHHACVPEHHEGIRRVIWLDEDELNFHIKNGLITDGFTLSALTLARAHLDMH